MSGTGRIVRATGPMVVASGIGDAALNEMVAVGEQRLLGEVIRIVDGAVTIQVYEDTSGLRLGEPVAATGAPLAVELGPGLLGQIFDGIQRPLPVLAQLTGDFIAHGATAPALDRTRRWRFEPHVAAGDAVRGGALLGVARADGANDERVLAPPALAAGRVGAASSGEMTVDDTVVALDDGRVLTMRHAWPVRAPRPHAGRHAPDLPFLTGQRVLDCFFPVAAGGVAVVPGGFGTGKTVLEQTLAKYAAADVIVYVGCGERGNEMSELLDEFPRLVDPRTGAPLMRRTVMIVNTSNMPVAAREASIFTGVTIAEYFRDQGLQVALMVDSTSRWAEALREISSRLEEMPAEEGYPTYLATRLSQFYERAGRVTPLGLPGEGSVTIVGAVSPPGGDFSEPVTQASLRCCGALWALSPDLARRRHFPAVDWSSSFALDTARLAPWFVSAAGEDWGALRDEAIRLLQRETELEEIAQLVGLEALQDAERVVIEAARLLREGFLRQSALDPADATCPPPKTRALLRLFLHWRRRAADAVDAGVSLKAILETGIDRTLVRAASTPAAEMEARALALLADLNAAVDGLVAAGAETAAGGQPWTS